MLRPLRERLAAAADASFQLFIFTQIKLCSWLPHVLKVIVWLNLDSARAQRIVEHTERAASRTLGSKEASRAERMAPENLKPTSETRSKEAMKRRTSERLTRGKEKLESASESREGGGNGASGLSPWAAAMTSRRATKCRSYQTPILQRATLAAPSHGEMVPMSKTELRSSTLRCGGS